MALRLIEGFDHLATGGMPLKGWSGWPGLAAITGRFGGQGADLRFSGGGLTTKSITTSGNTVIAGFAVQEPFQIGNFRFYLRAGSTNVATVLFSGGNIVVLDSSSATAATGSSSGFVTGSWYYIEIKLVVNGASGSCAVQLNGVSEIGTTTHNFGSSTIDNIGLGTGPDIGFVSRDSYYDDVYACDGSGSLNNTFLGDSRVETLYPSGAGAHTQWTPDSGANYARVNETLADGDTSYVRDQTVGDRDSYAFADLTTLAGSVFGVQKCMYARKDSTGARQICSVARPGSTDRDGATVTLGSSYAEYLELLETNPDTSAAWTIAGVNGSEFGVKLVA